MKRLCSWLLITALFFCLIPAAAAENDAVFIVGQTEYPFEEDASGSGWNFDAQTQTMTLEGLRYPDDDWENYLDFSGAAGEFHLVLAEGSENAVGMISLNEQTFISGTGSLEAKSIFGSITMKDGTLRGNCIYGGVLTVDGGSVILDRTKALSSLVVNGGSVTISDLDTYALMQHGGTLRASSISNCNGIDVPYMAYCLTGGSLILENTDEENPWGVFLCVSYSTSPRLLAQALSRFGGMMVDADGEPLVLKYTGYTLDDENAEGLTGEEDQYYVNVSASLYNSDGTIANYAEFRLATSCAHQGEICYRCNEERHWQACIDCGSDLPDTEEMHNHVSLGEDKLCICGDSVREDGAVEDRAAELALYFWGAGRPMPYILHEALDQNKDNVITLQEVALLQLSAEGKAIPEELNVVGMSYQENGRAEKTLSMQGDLSGNWHTAKLYILDAKNSAPLAQPICVFSR